MSPKSETPASAGRPRSEEAHQAILDATLALLVEFGFSALTVEGVATEYMTQIEVTEGSSRLGRSVREEFPSSGKPTELKVLQLIRAGVIRAVNPDDVLQLG